MNSHTVTFGKHKGISVLVLVDKYPEYCEWVYHIDSSGQGSAHVKQLCQDIKEVKQLNKSGISGGTKTGSFKHHQSFSYATQKQPEVPKIKAYRATTLGGFLEAMGIAATVSEKPDNVASFLLTSLVVYEAESNPMVEVQYSDAVFLVYHPHTGVLLGGS